MTKLELLREDFLNALSRLREVLHTHALTGVGIYLSKVMKFWHLGVSIAAIFVVSFLRVLQG